MTNKKSIRRGDIYYVRGCNDTLGAEQKASSGRPAIIVSNNIGNEHSKIKQIVYITKQAKKWIPTHVVINSSPFRSIAICEQIITVSDERIELYVGHCTEEEMEEIDKALAISIGLDEHYK